MYFVAQSHCTYTKTYILQRWRLDTRYQNVAIENSIRPFPIQGTRGTARLWTLRSKFNAILEMVADSDLHLSKLDAVLERFAEETSNEYKIRSVNYQSSQSKTSIGSSGSVVILRDSEELNIRDPIGHVPTKGRPRACLLYTSPSPRDRQKSRMPSSA